MKDRLEQRANRVPPRDPRDVFEAAQARAGTVGPVRGLPRHRILAVAAGVVGVVALTVGGLAALSNDADDAVTVAGPHDTAPQSPDGNWALTAVIRDGQRQAAVLDALVTIDGDAVRATDGCDNTANAALDGSEIRTGGGSLKFVACDDAAHDVQAQAFWGLLSSEPAVEVRSDELLIRHRLPAGGPPATEPDALIFDRTGATDDLDAPTPVQRPGRECPGLRTETVWSDTVGTGPITAPAGGRVTYEETVTNDGTETCTIVWQGCPAPGALFLATGEAVPTDIPPCLAVGYPPSDLDPGDSRTDTWVLELNVQPGLYELRVPEREGTNASLAITVNASVDECAQGTVALRTDPPFDQYVDPGDVSAVQLQFDPAPERCTVRLAEVSLRLARSESPRLVAYEITNREARWYTSEPGAGVVAEASLGPVELSAGQYEGSLRVRLDNGESFEKPARLLVGDGSAGGPPSRPVEVISFELVDDYVLRLTLAYCGDAWGVHAEESAETVTVRAETSDGPATVAPDCATTAEITLSEALMGRTVIDGNTDEPVRER